MSALSSQGAADSTSDCTRQGSTSRGRARTTSTPPASSTATGLPSLLPETCERSTPDSLLSMCSPAGFRARTSPMLASVLDSLTAHARDCGSSSPGSFAHFDPDTSSWRTSQVSLLPDSDLSWPIWPKRGMTRAGVASEPPTSEPRIGASESSWLLPTPTAQEPGFKNRTPLTKDGNTPTHGSERWYDAETGRVMQKGLSQVMASVLKTLPTPTGDDASNVTRDSGEFRSLSREIHRLLRTPTAGDGKSSGSRNLPGSKAHAGVSLTDAVRTGNSTTPRLLPTPMANPDNPGADGELRAALTHGVGRRNKTGTDTLGRPNSGRPSGELTATPFTDGNKSPGPHPNQQMIEDV